MFSPVAIEIFDVYAIRIWLLIFGTKVKTHQMTLQISIWQLEHHQVWNFLGRILRHLFFIVYFLSKSDFMRLYVKTNNVTVPFINPTRNIDLHVDWCCSTDCIINSAMATLRQIANNNVLFEHLSFLSFFLRKLGNSTFL